MIKHARLLPLFAVVLSSYGCSGPSGIEVKGHVIGEDGLRPYALVKSGGAPAETVVVEFVQLDSKDKETGKRYRTELQEQGVFQFDERLSPANYGVVVTSLKPEAELQRFSMATAREKAKVTVSPTSRAFIINLATPDVVPIPSK